MSETVTTARTAATERDRPLLHIHPEHGWLNDPNGICRIDGRYHVFYQHNPAAPVHADVHWGHTSSTDLLTWRPEPVALTPRPDGPDEGGCWSGCVVDDDGVPTAVYTGVRSSAADAGVTLARSDRSLRNWTVEDQWVVGVPAHAEGHRDSDRPGDADKSGDPGVPEARDPFVFTRAGRRYAVQGAGGPGSEPSLLLYGCDDLAAWSYLGPLLTPDDPVAAAIAPANIWECPNLFQLGDRWVLLLSLWRDGVLDGVRYLLGDLVEAGDGLRFVAASGGTLDAGPTFYAPQALVGADRVLLWGWAWEGRDRTQAAIDAAGWCGTLTSPREVVRDGDTVVLRPAAELVGLRRRSIDYTPGDRLDVRAFEVQAPSGLRLVLTDPTTGERRPVVSSDGSCRLLVDGSLVELFEETTSSTTRAYPGADAHWAIESGEPLDVWELGLPS